MNGTLIEAFAAAGKASPDARLIVMSDASSTDARLSTVIAAGRRLGTRMMAAGVLPGDVVAVMLPNWCEWQAAAVATQQAGAVLLPIVTIYGAKELAFILRQSLAVWLFTPGHLRSVDYATTVQDCGDLPDLQRGTRGNWPGYDSIFNAIAGWEFENAGQGNKPIMNRPGTMDIHSAHSCLVSIMAALYARRTTGKGHGIQTSLLGVSAFSQGERLIRADGGLTETYHLTSD
jgi:CoA-transferase family III/AMP-binding enzyme